MQTMFLGDNATLQSKILGTITDYADVGCNSRTTGGIYTIGASTPDKPVQNLYGILIVIGKCEAERQIQFLCASQAIYYRRCSSGSYSGVSWKEL